MLTVPTQLDYMYVHDTLDTLEMDKLAQVILITSLQCPEKALYDGREATSIAALSIHTIPATQSGR